MPVCILDQSPYKARAIYAFQLNQCKQGFATDLKGQTSFSFTLLNRFSNIAESL